MTDPSSSERSAADVVKPSTLKVAKLGWNADGLIPVVTQDAATKAVLMLAWMNAEALTATLTTGRATYFSRSRQRLWVKGETSGHTQAVREVRQDCDGDTLLLTVDQVGGACHTGDVTCFDAGLMEEMPGVDGKGAQTR